MFHMKSFFFILFSTLLVSEVSAQYSQTVTPIIDRQFGLIAELHPVPGDVKGSVYLNDNWLESVFYLKPDAFTIDTLQDVQVKLNLRNNAFEIKSNGGIKVLEGSKVDRFE